VIEKQDQPRTYPDGSPSWTLGQPVGHAQALEIITLQQLGFEFVVHATPAAFLEVRGHSEYSTGSTQALFHPHARQ